jgi:AcrR family transcriptional regulator
MARPKEHGERTAVALLDAAEQIVAGEGVDALSVRRVANELGTTTRAIYSLFGSKDGLVVALGARAFDLLGAEVNALPVTDDPAGDLLEAGMTFRRFALSHPALFRLGVQHEAVSAELVRGFAGSAQRALGGLNARITRLAENGQLGARGVSEAILEFHALCEGLAALELRCRMPPDEGERLWRDALGSLVAGWHPT